MDKSNYNEKVKKNTCDKCRQYYTDYYNELDYNDMEDMEDMDYMNDFYQMYPSMYDYTTPNMYNMYYQRPRPMCPMMYYMQQMCPMYRMCPYMRPIEQNMHYYTDPMLPIKQNKKSKWQTKDPMYHDKYDMDMNYRVTKKK